MQQNSIPSSPSLELNLKPKELLGMSLPYIKTFDQIDHKQALILKHAQEQDYLPLSLAEQSLLEDK